jgi:hypothetical protein
VKSGRADVRATRSRRGAGCTFMMTFITRFAVALFAFHAVSSFMPHHRHRSPNWWLNALGASAGHRSGRDRGRLRTGGRYIHAGRIQQPTRPVALVRSRPPVSVHDGRAGTFHAIYCSSIGSGFLPRVIRQNLRTSNKFDELCARLARGSRTLSDVKNASPSETVSRGLPRLMYRWPPWLPLPHCG